MKEEWVAVFNWAGKTLEHGLAVFLVSFRVDLRFHWNKQNTFFLNFAGITVGSKWITPTYQCPFTTSILSFSAGTPATRPLVHSQWRLKILSFCVFRLRYLRERGRFSGRWYTCTRPWDSCDLWAPAPARVQFPLRFDDPRNVEQRSGIGLCSWHLPGWGSLTSEKFRG